MIKTYPLFYYGFEISESNQYIDFKEGSGSEITAEVDVGSYTPTKFCEAIKNALATAGTLSYSVTFNRATRIITITSTGGSFKLLGATGSHAGETPLPLMGISVGADTTLGTSLSGTGPAGDIYKPQIWLQDYVASENLQGAIDASVNRTAGGKVEVIKFGTESFMECIITLASNANQKIAGPYRPSPTGEDDLRRFLQFLTTKAPIEFAPDENDPSEFETLMLESTTESPKGVKYRMKELWDKGLQNYFDSGKLVFRVIED